MRKNWLINVSEEPYMINTTLDSLRQLGVSLFLAFQAIRKKLKYVKFRLATNQGLFHARSVSGMVIPASVKSSGQMMQEIHQIIHWKQLETNLDLLLI